MSEIQNVFCLDFTKSFSFSAPLLSLEPYKGKMPKDVDKETVRTAFEKAKEFFECRSYYFFNFV